MNEKRKVNTTITHRVIEGKMEFTVHGGVNLAPIVFDPGKASATNRARAMLHGWIQRVSDGGAIERADKEGNLRSKEELAAMRHARMLAIVNHYEAGTDDWTIRPVAQGVDAGMTIQGIIRAGLATDVDGANGLVERLATKRGIDRTASLRLWAASDKVARAIAEIRAERASGNAEELLAEIEEGPGEEE
jgi:hypothetical protein